MTTDENLSEVAKNISPQSAREYVKANGWELVKEPIKGRFYLFRHSVDQLRQLIIPMDSTDRDYAEMLIEAAAKIASVEKRPTASVMNDLLRPDADILRFRLAEAQTITGSVPLLDGINLLTGAKKALLAAACSVVSPQSHHPRMARTEAEQLLAACQLGQTERSSYVVIIACPLNAVDATAPMLQGYEPFVRQATKLLLKSSQRIVESIEKDDVEKIYDDVPGEPVISSNLCDALLQMQATHDDAALSISAKWASTEPKPRINEAPQEVRFSADYFTTISDIYTKLRPSGEDQESTFAATVETLNGDIGSDGRRAGDVGLWVLQKEETIPARVDLKADQYEIADKAHMAGAPVAFKGILHRGRRVHKITNVENFTLLAR